MMLQLRRGRAKTARAIWWQGKAGASPHIDATGATCSVIDHNLSAPPTIAVVNLVLGTFDIVFGAGCSSGMNRGDVATVTIALDFPGGPSPDPVDIPVAIL